MSALPIPLVERDIDHGKPIQWPDLASLAVLSMPSPATRRNYSREIRAWLESGLPLDRTGVQLYMQSLDKQGKSASVKNLALAAIRLLAREANERSLISDVDIAAIERVKTTKVRGTRLGQWLSREQAQKLVDVTVSNLESHPTDLTCSRDLALLCVLLGCGMRRSEPPLLTWEQWCFVGDRWVWKDVLGKGNKYRTIPANSWTVQHVERWKAQCQRAGIKRPFEVSSQTVYNVSRALSNQAGLGELAPHHLRRTFARLAHEAGAPLDQIQYILGHSSLVVTMRYVGSWLELRPGRAATDYVLARED